MSEEKIKTITLREHEYLYLGSGENDLEPEDFDELKAYIEKLDAQEDAVKQSGDTESNKYKPPLKVLNKKMKALKYVGAILTEQGTQIEILPKIDLGGDDKSEDDNNIGEVADKDNSQSTDRDKTQKEEEKINDKTRDIFMRMLQVYLGRHHRQFDRGIWGNSRFPLLEAFMAVFLAEVSILVRRGLARSYIPHEENLTCLKGKLDFSNHIRHNLFHKERFYVRYDEFSIDRPINRVIKKALREVSRVSQNSENYRRAGQLLNYFEEVSSPRDWRHEVKISSMDRSVKYKAYEESFEWAKLILQNFSPDNREGERKTIALLFPMEAVFEKYIEYILDKGFRTLAPNWNFKSQSKEHKIMGGYENNVSFAINPDLLAIDENNHRCVILDTKWKRINQDNTKNKYDISQSDIYQLYSYGKVYQRKDKDARETSLVLLYPQNTRFTKVIDFSEDGMKSSRHENSLDRADSLNLKLFPIDLSGLTQKDSNKLEEAEQEIAANIIKECIPGLKASDKKVG